MKPVLFLLAAALPLCAQVKFTQSPDRIEIEIDGKPFSTFYIAGDAPKPYMAPLRSADGVVVTRRFPMEKVEGETRDHPHHRGLWFTHGDVNKIDYWMNEKGAKGVHGAVKLEKVQQLKGGRKSGVIKASFIWESDKGVPLLREARTMTFYPDPKLRIVDFDATLTALEQARFGDTKEGFFAIRLRDEMREVKGTGKMTASDGKTGMKQVWGASFPWVDYSGTVDGRKLGVAIFDSPKSFRYPTYWHARDYGLFAANPFGLHDFLRDKTKDGGYTLPKGQSIRFIYRVVIHPGDTAEADVAGMYDAWAKGQKK
jgi:hypothetical protein